MYKCDISGNEFENIGDAEIERHKNLVHHCAENILTEKECEELISVTLYLALIHLGKKI